MTLLTYTLPEVGQSDFSQDPRIVNALSAILTWAGGQITGSNIKAEGLEGANCNKELPKLTTGATYSEAKRAFAVEFTPSATRPCIINVSGKCEAAQQGSIAVLVGGVKAAETILPGKAENVTATASANGIFVPAGSVVKIEKGFLSGEATVWTLLL